MRLKQLKDRITRIIIEDFEGSERINGTGKRLTLYDTSVAEVFSIVHAAIEKHVE